MADGESLLWSNASPLMRAVSEAGARRPAPPLALIERLWSPKTCPPEALPHLAAAVGVAVWNPEWPEPVKRRVIERTIVLKRRRGTIGAFEEHLGFIDAELVELRAPPQVAAPRAPRTIAERERWARQFPELRVYAYRTKHTRRGVIVAGRPLGGARRVSRVSGAPANAGYRATIVEGGIERDIPITASAGEFMAAIPRQGVRFTPGRVLSRSVPRSSTARDRVFTYRPGRLRLDTLPPGMTPLDIEPKRVGAVAERPRAITPGVTLFGGRRILRPSTAKERVFDSVRVFDAEKARRGVSRPRGGWILGRTKLGQAPFELELSVDLSRPMKGRRPFPRLPGVLREHDKSRVAEAIATIRAAKLGRDRVRVRTGLSRPISVGDGLTVSGGYRVGQIIRSL